MARDIEREIDSILGIQSMQIDQSKHVNKVLETQQQQIIELGSSLLKLTDLMDKIISIISLFNGPEDDEVSKTIN